jgi:hypothetical protein
MSGSLHRSPANEKHNLFATGTPDLAALLVVRGHLVLKGGRFLYAVIGFVIMHFSPMPWLQ